MSARSSPDSTPKDTPSRTCSPPKASRTSRSSSSAIPAARAAVLLHVAIAAARADAAKIELRYVRMRAQPLWRAVEYHAPVFHYVTIVRDIERETRVLLYEEHGHPELTPYGLQPLHQLLHQ